MWVCFNNTLVSDGKSSYNKTFDPIVAFEPIFTPGEKLELIPVFTESPIIAPSLRLPLSSIASLILVLTFSLSKRKLARLVPAAILQLDPIIESPT